MLISILMQLRVSTHTRCKCCQCCHYCQEEIGRKRQCTIQARFGHCVVTSIFSQLQKSCYIILEISPVKDLGDWVGKVHFLHMIGHLIAVKHYFQLVALEI